jgi:lipopolysaccharide export system permease protein
MKSFLLLDRYISRRLVLFTLVILLIIVSVLQMLDLLSNADEIMAAPGASFYSLAKYVALRAPELVVRFAPFAVLLAVLLNLVQLAGASEIIAMRASGMSPSHILRPMLVGAAGFALVHFAFQEWVAASATSRLQSWQDSGYSNLKTGASQERKNIWVSAPGLIAYADTAYRYNDKTKLANMSVYQIGDDGLLTGVIVSKSATPGTPAWSLSQTLRCTSNENQWTYAQTIGWTTPLEIVDFFPNAEARTIRQLRHKIDKRRRANLPIAEPQTALFVHFSRPFSDIIMPLIGLFIGFSLPRMGTYAMQLLAGLGAGFVFFALDSFSIAVGNSGALPAFVAAFGAPLMFALAGAYALIHLER